MHADGIANRHVKFPNGQGIELIKASAPPEALARDYTDWLQDSDGAAFWSLYTPDLTRLSALHSALKLNPSNTGGVVTFSQKNF